MVVPACQNQSRGLPASAALYEMEYEFWPWGLVVEQLRSWLVEHAPDDACIIDYMCGTGFLLNSLKSCRPDLRCFGCSLTAEYIEYAQSQYPEVSLSICDAREYVPPCPPDVVICAAGLHHLPYDQQPVFLQKIASELEPGKWLLIAEEVLPVAENEQERRVGAVNLHAASIKYMIKQGAPIEMVLTALEVLTADLLLEEYKVSRRRLREIVLVDFEIVDERCVWPAEDCGFGNLILFCRRR